MNRSMPLNPRITLPTPRHLMRVPRMIGRLTHPSPALDIRLHAALARPALLEIHLPRMMKTTLILSHVTTSHRRRRRVRVRVRQPVAIQYRPRRLRRNQHLLNPLQYINHTLTLTPLRLPVVLVVPSVDAHRKSRRHLTSSKIFPAQIFFSTSVL
jgi:hypothetical protein